MFAGVGQGIQLVAGRADNGLARSSGVVVDGAGGALEDAALGAGGVGNVAGQTLAEVG